jgi:3-hydroxyisobutyrate dehydrogenase-like beta-hydroxyacid dehydrogenase
MDHSLLSCPVFGRPEAAVKGTLNLCLAGPRHAKEVVAPYLKPLGRIWDFGYIAAGANAVKLAGNFMISALIETLAEAFTLVENHDISQKDFFDLMSQSLFNAPAVHVYGQLLLNADFSNPGFLTSLGAKDSNLVKKAARLSHTPMPFASVLEDRFIRAMAKGWGDKDWSIISQLQRDDAGLNKVSSPG